MKKSKIWKKFSKFKETAYLNNQAYTNYFEWMKEIMLNRYNWVNLPPNMNERYIEESLFYKSGIAVFRDEVVGGLANLPFNPISHFDIYGNPVDIQVYSGFTEYHRTLYKDEYVIVWCNFNRIPPVDMIEMYAYRLYECVRTCDVNIINQKTPKLIKASESQKLTIQQIVKDIDGNVPTIAVKDTFNDELLVPIDLTVPYLADKLDAHQQKIWCDFLTYAGIENSGFEKKERLVANEVNANYGNIEMSRNTGLRTRQEAARAINEKWGTNIAVEFNSDIPTIINMSLGSDVDV